MRTTGWNQFSRHQRLSGDAAQCCQEQQRLSVAGSTLWAGRHLRKARRQSAQALSYDPLVFPEWTFDPVHTVAVSFRHLTYSLKSSEMVDKIPIGAAMKKGAQPPARAKMTKRSVGA